MPDGLRVLHHSALANSAPYLANIQVVGGWRRAERVNRLIDACINQVEFSRGHECSSYISRAPDEVHSAASLRENRSGAEPNIGQLAAEEDNGPYQASLLGRTWSSSPPVERGGRGRVLAPMSEIAKSLGVTYGRHRTTPSVLFTKRSAVARCDGCPTRLRRELRHYDVIPTTAAEFLDVTSMLDSFTIADDVPYAQACRAFCDLSPCPGLITSNFGRLVSSRSWKAPERVDGDRASRRGTENRATAEAAERALRSPLIDRRSARRGQSCSLRRRKTTLRLARVK